MTDRSVIIVYRDAMRVNPLESVVPSSVGVPGGNGRQWGYIQRGAIAAKGRQKGGKKRKIGEAVFAPLRLGCVYALRVARYAQALGAMARRRRRAV